MKSTIKLIIAINILFTNQLFSQEAPYPVSKVIKNIEWFDDTIISFGQGSDQWPMTWAVDNHLYAAWGDGWGWNNDKKSTSKKSIGVTQIMGTPDSLTGVDLWGEGPGKNFGKPDALISFDDQIFMYFTRGDSKYDDDTYLAVSSDSGKSWKLSDSRLMSYVPAGFRVRGVCQFGKGYQDAKDDYLYVYFGMNRHPDIYLARVPKESLSDEFKYEWFKYIKSDGSAQWTTDFSKKSVVFHDNQAYGWHFSVVYHPGIDRMLLTKPHYDKDDNRNTVYIGKSGMNGLGVFDAPTPWGPWTTVYYKNTFLDDYVKFNYIIPGKFLNTDSNTFWMAWSGWPEYDNVNFIKARLILY